MKFFELKCSWCKQKIYRNRGRINEAKKLNWKTYCSLICQKQALSKKREFQCGGFDCSTTFFRALHDIHGTALYCSQKCAAIVNNTKYPKRKAVIKDCLRCEKSFKGEGIFCSRRCKDQSQVLSAEEVTKDIKEFYLKYGRIPLKRENLHYHAARLRFGSWNKAIEAAGFKANPVLFALRHIANDGHQCDSLAEKIIDDWLTDNKIPHKRSVPYPEKKALTADFVIGKTWVEFFGLAGVLTDYDELVKQKQLLAKRYGLDLIALYPKDLFPHNNLATILKAA